MTVCHSLQVPVLAVGLAVVTWLGGTAHPHASTSCPRGRCSVGRFCCPGCLRECLRLIWGQLRGQKSPKTRTTPSHLPPWWSRGDGGPGHGMLSPGETQQHPEMSDWVRGARSRTSSSCPLSLTPCPHAPSALLADTPCRGQHRSPRDERGGVVAGQGGPAEVRWAKEPGARVGGHWHHIDGAGHLLGLGVVLGRAGGGHVLAAWHVLALSAEASRQSSGWSSRSGCWPCGTGWMPSRRSCLPGRSPARPCR